MLDCAAFFSRDWLMQRIVILGNAGSGKSTLARELGRRLDVPVVHLDRLFWEPGWVEAQAEVFRQRVREAVATDAWICEGNYSRRTFDLRLPQAELVIWIDTPRAICLKRVLMRTLRNRPRADLPAGCREQLNREFLKFLGFVWHFDQHNRPGIEQVRQTVGPQVPVIHLRGARQIARFLDDLPSRLPG